METVSWLILKMALEAKISSMQSGLHLINIKLHIEEKIYVMNAAYPCEA